MHGIDFHQFFALAQTADHPKRVEEKLVELEWSENENENEKNKSCLSKLVTDRVRKLLEANW